MESVGGNGVPVNGFTSSWLGRGQAYGMSQAEGGAPVSPGDRFAPRVARTPDFSGAYASQAASSGDIFSGFMQAMQGIFNQLASLMQGLQGQQTAQSQGGAQQYFSDASMSSTGDPHEALNGTTGDGRQLQGKWDSMCSHDHLITSDAIPGGFNVASQVTAPDAKGVTYNDRVTIASNNGNTVVTMGKSGACTVVDNGRPVALTAGGTSTLSNGEQVRLNTDGSVTVGVSNGRGGSINTTLKSNGNGVDVNATAHDVDLGGYLVNKQDAPSGFGNAFTSQPLYQPTYQPAYQSPYQSSYQPDAFNAMNGGFNMNGDEAALLEA